ncbi:3 exoribonuclease family protein [Grosmannia clavigera kw1407]|uniref:Ribosomal RNA-processing protein 42 n=1 Tax=Grosmannia clavigera (strain kw1407 / UAMH 11150) TaxID=655863 RepID=F0XU13_GROCL|nr:3 exoribonuclease family protein [Grosmannia clavigera kw1407]EFW98905.1 3 exoribonuclease family protein [Grosmannia clavigera kw1407]
MAPRKNKARARSSSTSLGESGPEEEIRTAATRPRATGKKAAQSSDGWDVWQDTVREQEADRVKQYMSTFQEKVASMRKKAVQDMRQSEESRVRTAYGNGLTETARSEMMMPSRLPLREASEEVLGLFQSMLSRFERTNNELREQCSCLTGFSASTGSTGPSLSVKAAWQKDHEEARKLLQYGRAYGDNLVHEIIVPQTDGNGSAPIAHADSIDLNCTGRSAIGLFPRSRATLVGGQTWGETARTQMQALTGIVRTLPYEEKVEIGGSKTPPIRPDGRSPTQFRPLRAETGMLPGANGSARVCFSDGTEAIVGVKADVEKTRRTGREDDDDGDEDVEGGEKGGEDKKDGNGVSASTSASSTSGASSWVEVTVEIPGLRDDDSNTVFLAALLAEALLADGNLAQALRINRRFHWKLYLDILLISPPLSYPLPLLSLTSHLALLATRLPRLVSEGDEDPFFNDDWDASTYLYPRATEAGAEAGAAAQQPFSRPPITLLVMTVGDSILFDPTSEELAVANAVLAVSVGASEPPRPAETTTAPSSSSSLRLLAIRTIDPPSRLTAPGTPYNPDTKVKQQQQQQQAAGSSAPQENSTPSRLPETEAVYGVWRAPRGGARVGLLAAMTQRVLEKGGVAEEVFAGLGAVEVV